MTTATASQTQTQQRPWWLVLITGVLAVIIGGILLWSPAKTKVDTYVVLVAILGIYWLVEGVLDLVSIFIDHSMWGWKLFIGIISIAAGAYILMYPLAMAVVLPQIFALILGIWGLVYGITLLIMAFRGGGWGAGILGGLGIIFGIALMGSYMMPGTGLVMLWTAAVFGVVGGIAMIFQAFRQRSG